MNSKPVGIFLQVDFLYREGRGGGRKRGISLEKRGEKTIAEREVGREIWRFSVFLFLILIYSFIEKNDVKYIKTSQSWNFLSLAVRASIHVPAKPNTKL